MDKREIARTILFGTVTAPAAVIAGAAAGAHRRLCGLSAGLSAPPTDQDSYTRDDLVAIQRQSSWLSVTYAVGAATLMTWGIWIGLPGGLGACGVACLLAALARRQSVRRSLVDRLLLPAVLLLLVNSSANAAEVDGLLAAFQAAAENDPAAQWLNAIVGAGSGGTAFSQLLGWSNSVALAIGSLLLAYNVSAGAMQTAHEGKILGRRWSSLWAPLRVPVAMSMLIPMPTGLSAWQEVVLSVAKYSIGAANMALTDVIDKVVNDATPIIDPPNPDARKLIAGLVENYSCSLILHQSQIWLTAGKNTAVPIAINRTDKIDRITLSFDGTPTSGLGQEACGAIDVSLAPTTKGLAADTRKAIQTAHLHALQAATEGALVIARQIAAHVLPADGQQGPLPPVGALETLSAQYQSALMVEVKRLIQGDKAFRSVREQVAAEIKSSGWSGLGAMHARMAALNATILEATTEIPEVRRPSQALSAANSVISQRNTRPDQEHWLILSSWLREALRDPDRLRYDAREQDDGASSILRFVDLGRAASAFDYIQVTNQGGVRSSVMQSAANVGHLVIPVGWVAFAGGFFHSTVGTLGIGLLALGGWLAYWLPMIPYLAWLGAVLAWLLLVIEALVAGPMWCLSHLRMDGEGISGGANTGWLVMLNISFRTVMLVIGFLVSIQMFELGGTFVGRTFIPAVSSMLGSHFGGISAFIAVLLLWIACLHLIANVSFGAITLLPDRIMRWIESQQAGIGEQQHVDRASHSAVAVVTGGHAGAVTGAMQAVGQQKSPSPSDNTDSQRNDKFFGGSNGSSSIQATGSNNSTGQISDSHGKFFK